MCVIKFLLLIFGCCSCNSWSMKWGLSNSFETHKNTDNNNINKTVSTTECKCTAVKNRRNLNARMNFCVLFHSNKPIYWTGRRAFIDFHWGYSEQTKMRNATFASRANTHTRRQLATKLGDLLKSQSRFAQSNIKRIESWHFCKRDIV